MKVNVPSLAKLNLDLRVLDKRPDGFHELRTIFQTISLGDKLAIEFRPARRTSIDLDCSLNIADNVVVRAARLTLDHLRVKAAIRITLSKRIPMGAGLGGGSSNAASVLASLPALAGRQVPLPELLQLAESLGSDVPFFLHGGTALGVGRGTELYPLPDQPARFVLVVSTGVHVSTADAYRTLARDVTNALTSQAQSPILREFQTIAWSLAEHDLEHFPLRNDFEEAVFRQHPELARVARKLKRLGAKPVRMTGSGSAIFGVFSRDSETRAAALQFPAGSAFPARFVSRRQYQQLWRRSLAHPSRATNRGD